MPGVHMNDELRDRLYKIDSFVQLRPELTDGVRMAGELQKLYRTVEDVDLFVGGLAEKPVKGGLVGKTFACILGHQFQKNGMAPSQFTEKQLMEIRKTSMSRILCENGRLDTIQPHAFEMEDDFDNNAVPCDMLHTIDLSHWRDESNSLEIPVSMESVKKAFEIGQKEVEERRRREAHNIKRNQQAFKDGDPLVSYGKMMRAKREAIELSQISKILLASSQALLNDQQALIGKDGLPLKLDRRTLQTILPQIDVSEFIGNFTALLGEQGSVNKCLPKALPCDHTSPYRTYSGWCNNLFNPQFGNAFGPLRHLLKPSYEDDRYSLMIMQFGQVLDHEVTHSPTERGPNDEILNCTRCDSQTTLSVHCMPLPVPENDPHFPTHFMGERRCLPFARSLLGQLNLGYRNQLNQLTAFLDGSVIYGATKCEANHLRMFRGGLMNFTNLGHHNPMALPQGKQEQDCRSSPKFQCFVAGDERNSHQPALTVMHNIFLREHNRIAAEIERLNPQWDDEKIYQETRRIVSAEFQHITYSEYLPKLIGTRLMAKHDLQPKIDGFFKGYNRSCDASISHPFATAAFRFGHTLIRRMFPRMDSAFHNMSAPVDLAEHFNNVEPIYDNTAGGMDSLLMGLLGTPSMAFDRHITDAVRNHLFARRGHATSGMDLITINILRARDHGVQPYNDLREFCGLKKARSWGDLSPSMDQTSIDALRKVRDRSLWIHYVYDHVDDIDIFPGLLSELPIKGALMPPTMACIIAEQFERLKKCDRFYYENDLPYTKFSQEQLNEIRKVTLGSILCANARSMIKVQPDVFIMPDELTNAQVPCRDFAKLDLKPWTDRPTCFIDDRHVLRGDSMKRSPCHSCTCTADGPRCRSLYISNCKQLLKDYSIEEVKKDMACVIQCATLIKEKTNDF
ncbi:hypothetical protein PENTCL1PPCAC_4765 [Pristionchus entomophagus]|uniref:Peroxidase n=1 Tax=Pristionchus entomophagus TaxID=358040 RepID=A0AAV5SH04_9BILA|nr:hypothetical protein PENTCL1PPCAC_4765 [Pristionchus entomophagus]